MKFEHKVIATTAALIALLFFLLHIYSEAWYG